MQSIASILEKEANFVAIFNEATHNNHPYGGYPYEQYRHYMLWGEEYMEHKWSCEKYIVTEDKEILEDVDVWGEMKHIALKMAVKEITKPIETDVWGSIGSAVEKGMNN